MRPGALGSLLALSLAFTLSTSVVALDSDGDGLPNGFERNWGVTDPQQRDSDHDGVVDAAEDLDGDRLGNLGEWRFGRNPGDPDSDGDGTLDGNEDRDRDGRTDAREQDQRPVPADLRPSLAQAKYDHPADRTRCMEPNTGSEARRCHLGDPDGDLRIVLMGDSHALMWLPPVKRSATREGWRLVTLLRGGCEPTLGTQNIGQYGIDRGASCRAWRQGTVDWLNGHPPDLIVIAHSDTYRLVDSSGKRIPEAERPAVWGAGMERMLASLPNESSVLLLGDAPKNRENPVECLRRHGSDMSACVSRRVPRSKRLVEAALRDAALAQGAQHRSLYGQVCTYDPCPLVHDDILLFRDRGHLTRTITERLTPSVRALLLDVLATSGADADTDAEMAVPEP